MSVTAIETETLRYMKDKERFRLRKNFKGVHSVMQRSYFWD